MTGSKLPKITRADIQSGTTARSFQRGEDYYATGAVSALVWRGDTVYAEVDGSSYEPYQVEVTFTDTGIGSAFCTCPYDWGGWCKHIVAVLLTVADAPDAIVERPPVEALLDALDASQLRALLQTLVAERPDLIDAIEGYVATVKPASAPEPAASPRTALPTVDPAPFRRQVHAILHSLDRMRASEAYWHVGGVVDQVRQVLDKAWALIRAGDGNNALRVLEGITDAYVNAWYNLDDSDGDAYAFFEDLAAAWTEAVLTADLTPEERRQWMDDLDDWQGEIADYGDEDVFATAQEALRQGWDYPPLLRVIRDGEITRDGAWEAGADAPYYADELTVARLNVLERQERYQEYLYLAEAEGQTARYVTMLVKVGRVAEAVEYGLKYLSTTDEALALSKALHEYGHVQEALRIAEHGLNLGGYAKAALAVWLRDVAAEMGETEQALRAAQVGFKAAVSLEAYRQVQNLAGDRWPALREELLTWLRQHVSSDQAAIEIFLHEGLVDDAIRALGDYPYYGAVEMVVDAAIETHPDWCIRACKAQAEPIMDQGRSKYYHHAARWLEKAKAAYLAAGRAAEWRAYLSSLLERHARKYSLVPRLKELR